MKAIQQEKNKPFESALPSKYVKALRKVQAQVLSDPKSFDMSDWGNVEVTNNECKTVGCICGWMAVLSAPKSTIKPILRFETKIETLTAQEMETADVEEYCRICRKTDEVCLKRAARGIPSLDSFISEYRREIPLSLRHEFDKLFYLENWPKRFRSVNKYGDDTTTAKKAAKRIDHFLKCGE